MKRLVAYLIIGISILITLGLFGKGLTSESSGDRSVQWSQVKKTQKAQALQGWSEPQFIPVNSKYWEDSLFVEKNGENIYFAYYPGDLINDVLNGSISGSVRTIPARFLLKTSR